MMWQMRQDAVRAFGPLQLRPIKALMLGFIARGMHHPKDISEVMDTVPPAISSMIKELEDKGYITRQLDPDDKRRVRLELTEAGRNVNEQMRTRWLATTTERLSQLSKSELEQFLVTTHKMLEVG